MTVLLDRWQFGVTITYHFLFVPLTIGLAFLVAIMQVLAYRRFSLICDRPGMSQEIRLSPAPAQRITRPCSPWFEQVLPG